MDPYVKKQNAKLIQVIQNFFSKALQIVLQARSLPDPTNYTADTESRSSKINKWFNLHMATPNEDWIRGEIKLWKSFTDVSQLPPMIIETYLDLRQLSPREIVVLEDDNGNSWTVAKGGTKKQEVVVERWLIEFDKNFVSGSGVDELPLIYKQAIVLLRVIYGITRLTPAFKLKKLLAKLSPKSLTLRNKFIDGKQPISSKGRIGLSKPVIPHQMLLTDSHMTQKMFAPIQTTLGTLRVSVAYRNHYRFLVQDNEEMLSNHFLLTDQEKAAKEAAQRDIGSSIIEPPSGHEDEPEPVPKSLHAEKFSVLPCTSEPPDDDLTPRVKHKLVLYAVSSASIQRPSIQPFKVGSIGNSPPQGTPHTPTSVHGSSMERRISITSNRSGSNASLAALLRNPRGSTSSSNTPNTIAIAGSQIPASVLFPRSVSSSHGSQLPQEDSSENISNTPRFSSSFGSRQSRRFSNTSARNYPMNETNTSFLGTSVELASSEAPLSGLYIDDDISTFVRMIDGKSDLRLSSSNQQDSKLGNFHNESNSQLDALSKFQLLKSQHQQLSESVSASLIFHHNQGGDLGGSGSKHSSRKSSHSVYTPPHSLPTGSYENAHLPSITSRLQESGLNSDSDEPGSTRSLLAKNSYSSDLKSSASKVASPVTATNAHAARAPQSASAAEGVSGLATTPSVYVGAKRPIKYEDVFEDDDDSTEYLATRRRGKSDPMISKAHVDDLMYDNDDLLFEMTDTR